MDTYSSCGEGVRYMGVNLFRNVGLANSSLFVFVRQKGHSMVVQAAAAAYEL